MFLEKIRDRFTYLISSALGLGAALAWNDAIRSIIEKFFEEEHMHIPLVIYAFIVTCVAVGVVAFFQKIGGKVKE